jgi:hypothetical protein
MSLHITRIMPQALFFKLHIANFNIDEHAISIISVFVLITNYLKAFIVITCHLSILVLRKRTIRNPD